MTSAVGLTSPSLSSSEIPSTMSRRALSLRPPTVASAQNHNGPIFAIYESRGMGRDVGIASLDRFSCRVTLVQISDVPTYVKTLGHLHIHSPSIILVLDTSFPSENSTKKPSALVQCMQEDFTEVSIECVARRYWNDTAGLEFISQLILDDENRASTLLTVSGCSFSLCAASALFKYAQTRLHATYPPKSLWIECPLVEGTMLIDRDTAKNLELVSNATHKKSKHSLFGLLNHTFTPMGGRFLRINLLAPPTIRPNIEARLEAVNELVKSEDIYHSVKAALRSMSKMDLDKLISAIITNTTDQPSISPREASTHVTNMLQLRDVVCCIPPVAQALASCHANLLRVVQGLLCDSRLGDIRALLFEGLNADAGLSKRSGLAGVNSKVYAVNVNFNRMLDVARETYKENVDDIFELRAQLSQEHNLPLSMEYQERGGGFWFTIAKGDLEGELPRGFLNVTTKGAKWCFTSMELKKRNARMKDALEEALLLSDKCALGVWYRCSAHRTRRRVIKEILEKVVENIGVFYKASEAIATLDMLWSFAHISILHNYVRPEFTGTLAIKAGRHPILENIGAVGTFVANDTYCDDAATFQMVQGPNMSGKSTYLRQLALLTILATCGCFVPAEYASFRLHDTLLTRLSNNDDPEKNLSTFSNEMACSAMILGLATRDSLILIDELGRGTSPIEGIGIAHAIAEQLIDLKAFTFFATHFHDLSVTLSRRSSVVNLHLAVQKNSRDTSGFGLQFQYRIIDGRADEIPHYGLELAQLADLPKEVLQFAEKAAHHLANLDAAKKEASKTTRIVARRKAILRVRNSSAYHPSWPETQRLSWLHLVLWSLARRSLLISISTVIASSPITALHSFDLYLASQLSSAGSRLPRFCATNGLASLITLASCPAPTSL
ncbi:muts domain V-domain-containing protein [Cantharellus anzutake]|uniref:muts domain V-domain-containing protein n=1 Tax=Cantharellus anzutake TaxID=1750568 RepID=UPI001907926B|nr:muts domain V-domain-containing protein [Cantharellus anzutake]KAF8327173.1 muts domain V-domain-containing protein [Cantharellus anzutake]